MSCGFFFFQAEDGIRYLVRSRGLGDVYKRQVVGRRAVDHDDGGRGLARFLQRGQQRFALQSPHLLSLIHI